MYQSHIYMFMSVFIWNERKQWYKGQEEGIRIILLLEGTHTHVKSYNVIWKLIWTN